LDEVSDGLLFARKNGEVIFINEPMKRIFLSLGITPYRKEAQLWEAIETHSLRAFGDRLLLQSGDKFYLFEKIQGNGQESQIVASDVTEEEFYTEELERNRKELLKVRAQLLSTLKALEDIEKEKEQVKIRSRFHDALGERISLLHVLLLDPEELHDLTPLRESLSHMSEELVSEEEATQGEDLGSLLSSFAAIGVKIVIDGALPEDREKREVLLKILREASTNAVRHASATEVVMKNRREVGAFESTFTNNGDPVVGPIREGTGFRGMRDSAKKLGGDVRISADPNLIIVVDLPER
jgi:signal transduction histidine kinase